MASKKQTFEDREKAAGLFGTTSGYSNQSDNRGTYSQINSAQANYKDTLENALGGRLTQSQIEKAQRHAGSMGLDFDPNAGYVPKGYGKTLRASGSQQRDSRRKRSAATGNTISKGGAAGLAAILSGLTEGEQKQMMEMLFGNSPSISYRATPKNKAYVQEVINERARMRAESQDQLLANQMYFLGNQMNNQTVYVPEWAKQARSHRLNNDIFS